MKNFQNNIKKKILFFSFFKFNTNLILNKNFQTINKKCLKIKEFLSLTIIKYLLKKQTIFHWKYLKETFNNISNKSFSKFYHFCLLFSINFCTLLLKIRNKIFPIFLFLTLPILPCLLIQKYKYLICPDIYKKHLAPNTSQLLEYFNIAPEIQNLLITYLLPLSAFVWIFVIYYLFFFAAVHQPYESFIEIILIYLLKIYWKDFLEEIQEESLETIIMVDEAYDKSFFGWTIVLFYFAWSKELLYNNFHFRTVTLKKRESLSEEHYWINYFSINDYTKIKNSGPNYHILKYISTLYDRKSQGDYLQTNQFFDFYYYYFKGINFSLHRYHEYFFNIGISIFIFLLLISIIIHALIWPYRSYMSKIHFDKFSYNYFRPFLDEYLYRWHRIFIKMPINKETFLIQDPQNSQYLDFFFFIPDFENDQPSIFEKFYNKQTYEPILIELEPKDDIEYEDLYPYIPEHEFPRSNLKGLVLSLFIISGVWLFLECVRQDPFFHGTTHQGFKHLIIQPKTIQLPWLFQRLQISSLDWFLQWPGWFLINYTFLKTLTFSISTKKINNINPNVFMYSLNTYNQLKNYIPLYKKTSFFGKQYLLLQRLKNICHQKTLILSRNIFEFIMQTIIPTFKLPPINKDLSEIQVKQIISKNIKLYYIYIFRNNLWKKK
jgi:hypothetical protein